MGRNRVVLPEVTRLAISDGDWIEVKRRLNVGDQKRLENAGLKPPVFVGGRIICPVDWEVHDLQRALIFLLDWSLRGLDDKPINVDWDGIKSLDPETFEEINQALLAHIKAEALVKKAEREARTEKATGAPTATPTPEPTKLPSGESQNGDQTSTS